MAMSSSPRSSAVASKANATAVETPRCDSSSSDDAPGPTARRPPMKNVSRERMKQETAFLRERVHELERELSRTLAKKALERCATPSPVWRDLAKRQAARREKSEQERDKLRARLIHQLQVAKSLETIFNNRSGGSIDDLCPSAGANGHKTYPVNNLALLHEQFMDEIDQMYPLVDSVFADHTVLQDLVESPTRRSTVVLKGEDDKLYVELNDTVYVPFSYERVCSAVWRAITTEFSRQERVTEQYRSTEDEFSCTYYSQSYLLDSVHNTMAAIVVRKFTEENRVVLVWRTVDWDRTPGVQRDYGNDMGWLVVTPLVDPATGVQSPEGAIVKVCDRNIPTWDVRTKLLQNGALQPEYPGASGERKSFEVGEFTNRILSCTKEDIAAITESIENILLDESIGSGDDGDLVSMIGELDTGRELSENPSTLRSTDMLLDIEL